MQRRLLVGLLLACCMVLGLAAPRASAQAVYGSILGTVTDPQGAAVAGAKITVTSITKGTSEETTTNESGNYTVTHLIPDTYKIKIEAQGFKTVDIATVPVSANESARADTQLQVGAVTQSVEVTGELPQLTTDRADVSVNFNTRYVEDLPILNRNFTNFQLLSPGSQKLVGWSHAATENPQGAQQIMVNGQHFSGTGFQLDGTDNQDPILGIIVVNPNLDAIQEAKISYQNMDAENGKAIASSVGVQIKSGTNEIHGTGFYYWRDNAQSARDPFTQLPGQPFPSGDGKQYGGSAGGPIIKDKLFVFGDYQGTTQSNGITNQTTIPIASVLSGCSPALTGFCDLSAYAGNIGNGKAGDPSNYLYDPTTGNPNTGAGRLVFCGVQGSVAASSCLPANNFQIPNSLISQQAANVLALFPQPQNSSTTNNYNGSGSGPFKQNSFDIRSDWNAPRNFQVFGRFSLDYFSLSGKGTLGALGGAGFGPGGLNGSSNVHNYSLATGFDKAIGTSWLTDFRFGWMKYNPQTAYSDASVAAMDALGIPGLNTGSGLPGPPVTGGLSSFNVNNSGNNFLTSFGDGLNVGRCNCPLTERENQWQGVNNWTKIHGNHTFKFGVDIRYATNLRVPSDANRTGILNFDSGATSDNGTGGFGLATFLLGDVTSFNRFYSTSLNAMERQWRTFYYGQDTWRITPKLTLSFGVRWEIYFPESVNAKDNGGFANIEEGVIRVAGEGPYGLNGNIGNAWKAFAPRVGLAYSFNPKTVLRLGYGRSFDIGVFGSNFGHVVTQNLPVLANEQIQSASLNPLNVNNNIPIFTLAQGPASFGLPLPISIPATGTLPLQGPQGLVDPRIRPTKQVLPTVDTWNLAFQRQLTNTINLEVTYMGNKGTHVFNGDGPAYNANPVALGAGTNLVTCNAAGSCSLAGFTPVVPDNARRPYFNAFSYPGYTNSSGGVLRCCSTDLGNYFGNDANNEYEAMVIKVDKRFSEGLQFMAFYTYSHAWAYNNGYYYINKPLSYGPNDMNRNHAFIASVVYQLPFGRGQKYASSVSRPMNFLIGGWQLTQTFNWSGGLPFTPSIGECGTIFSGSAPCLPNKIGSFKTGVTHSGGNTYWFQPVAPLAYSLTPAQNGVDSCTLARPTSGGWALPACGTTGNAGLYSIRGPHGFWSDFSLSKNFTITERYSAQFRFDAYNVFNHVVLGFNGNQGNTCVDCGGNAGQITDIEHDASPASPTGMRQIQFGLRFIF